MLTTAATFSALELGSADVQSKVFQCGNGVEQFSQTVTKLYGDNGGKSIGMVVDLDDWFGDTTGRGAVGGLLSDCPANSDEKMWQSFCVNVDENGGRMYVYNRSYGGNIWQR